MKPLPVLLALSFAPALLPPAQEPAPQAPQEEVPRDQLPPYERFLATERERLETEIQGNWLLIEFENPNEPARQSVMQGWASFNQGYLTLFLQYSAVEAALLREVQRRYVEVAAHRYRISEDLLLQTASILGTSNMNPSRELVPEEAGTAREFRVQLQDGLLELITRKGTRITFRRVEETAFPVDAVLDLEATRSR